MSFNEKNNEINEEIVNGEEFTNEIDGENNNFDPEMFQEIYDEFEKLMQEEVEVDITDEEVEEFKKIYAQITEEKFYDENGEQINTIAMTDDQIKVFLANIKKQLSDVTNPENFTEKELAEREKKIEYLDSKNGEIMLSIGKPEDFEFNELTEEERTNYFSKYLDLAEEYELNRMAENAENNE